jgi:hypothetical protein
MNDLDPFLMQPRRVSGLNLHHVCVARLLPFYRLNTVCNAVHVLGSTYFK